LLRILLELPMKVSKVTFCYEALRLDPKTAFPDTRSRSLNKQVHTQKRARLQSHRIAFDFNQYGTKLRSRKSSTLQHLKGISR
jgi:hypothetical protein